MDIYAMCLGVLAVVCLYAAWATRRESGERRDANLLAGTATALGLGGAALAWL